MVAELIPKLTTLHQRFDKITASTAPQAAILLLSLIAFSLVFAPESYATTLTVCSSGCDYTTIANAIAAANLNGGDTIVIRDAVHDEWNITVDRNLTIEGQGAASTAIDGAASGTVFFVNAGVVVTFQGLTVRNGSGTPCSGEEGGLCLSGGGGLFNSRGTVTINNCRFSGNSVTGGTAMGGGLYNLEGTLTIVTALSPETRLPVP
jgi:hypothetical protein